MCELTTKEVREQVARYLAGALQPADFHDWFAHVLRDAHKSGGEVEALVHDIEWAFCDLERGILPDDVRRTLLRLATPSVVIGPVQSENDTSYSGTSSSFFQANGAVALGPPRRLLEGAPA